MLRAVACALAALLALAAHAAPPAAEEPAPVTLYANEFLLPGLKMESADRTVEAIARAVAPRPLKTVVVGIEELDEAVRQRKADIVIAGAAIYRRHVQNGMRDIATLVTELQPDPDHAVGGLIVTRADRSDISTLADLRGKSLAVNHPVGFQGILVLKKDLADAGYNPEQFFSRIEYYGLEPGPRLNAVRNGLVDAATINVCYAERMERAGANVLEGLKTVAERKNPEARCRASTSLYPNWSLLVSPNLDAGTIVRIASAVHTMPPGADGHQWTIASDFSRADDLYRTLRMGPYAYLRSWTLERILAEYGTLVAFALLALAGLVLHYVRTQRLVEIRTRQLRLALEREKELSEAAGEATRRYETARRIATVSQMSSLVAHEISQPLAGILLYCRGMRELIARKAEAHGFSPELLTETLDKIEARARKASDVVKAVRGYAKSQARPVTKLGLCALVSKTAESFARLGQAAPDTISLELPREELWVDGVAIELELMLANLVKNSLEATSKVPRPKVSIQLEKTPGTKARIRVLDNGPAVSDGLFEQINRPLSSSKPEGLGLGLSIVRGIAEGHGGTVSVSRTEAGSLGVEILLPLSAPAEDTHA
ncbi:PhnD/SsuA/transferrin family substrate-binding protein [Mesosutterella sp. OilRF-GAM-744-9]|uniref:histidine kinase n=1 Tax=Mesosutterella porci TaxID=2915351 RepID=A0ABS9MRW3_9BURK|nr:PhnD/SsuA/transferrin family substrate-binding protein [Mesosutterella sp. oilRF-744-WT-GAM-9]MCG5030743.1 PhnD/SsuA/transferrin family substrate-binding protein [Mesosutterella sp. oilRF-744-WT-GAM-9]